jgi:hypothetical protein
MRYRGFSDRVGLSREAFRLLGSDLDYLTGPSLLQDSTRRVKTRPRAKVQFEPGWGAPAAASAAAVELLSKPQKERVAERVDRLEDIAAEKASIPGHLMFLWEPTCRQLAAEGDAAVIPLIDAIEQDRRHDPQRRLQATLLSRWKTDTGQGRDGTVGEHIADARLGTNDLAGRITCALGEAAATWIPGAAV